VVALTQGIVNLLNERELKGVIAHELAHIKNRDVLIATIAAGIAAAVTYLAHAAQFATFFGGASHDNDDEGGSWLQTLLMILLAPIAATLVQLGISRSREFHADETAARLTGDPEALASALAKMEQTAQVVHSHVEPAAASLFIVNPLSGRSLMGLFSTHPPMEERIRRLRGLDVGTRRLVHDF
jgi:heat shock protein HtpX